MTHFRNLVQNKIDTKLEYLKTSAQVPAKDVPVNFVPNTTLAGIVPFLVKHSPNAESGITNIHTEQIAALRRKWGNSVIDTIGMSYIGVPEAVNAGWPVWTLSAANITPKVEAMMTSICEELHARIG